MISIDRREWKSPPVTDAQTLAVGRAMVPPGTSYRGGVPRRGGLAALQDFRVSSATETNSFPSSLFRRPLDRPRFGLLRASPSRWRRKLVVLGRPQPRVQPLAARPCSVCLPDFLSAALARVDEVRRRRLPSGISGCRLESSIVPTGSRTHSSAYRRLDRQPFLRARIQLDSLVHGACTRVPGRGRGAFAFLAAARGIVRSHGLRWEGLRRARTRARESALATPLRSHHPSAECR